MFELIFEVVGEFLIQLVIEVLVEMGIYTMAEGKERNPFFSALGYLLLGAVLGALSLLVFPICWYSPITWCRRAGAWPICC